MKDLPSGAVYVGANSRRQHGFLLPNELNSNSSYGWSGHLEQARQVTPQMDWFLQ
jgi:hypothetical protein